MTEKRYSKMMNHYGTSRTYCTGIYDNQNNRELQNSNQVITELNALHEENEQLKRINKRCSDSHLRMRNRLERLHKDWDKICDICKDKGMADEEIIKEMER